MSAAGNSPCLTVSDLQLEVDKDFRLAIPYFDVHKNTLMTIIGANGAGKSTLLEALLDLRPSIFGSVEYFGIDKSEFFESNELTRLGVQLQKASFNNDYVVREVVRLHECVYRRSNQHLVSVLGIEKLARRKYGSLSRGEKQRVDLFLSLAHSPELVILDEPSTGLDGNYANVFEKLLGDLCGAESEASVLMASHNENEVGHSDKLIWLENGDVIDIGAPDELLQKYLGERSFSITFSMPNLANDFAGEMAYLPGVVHMRRPDAASVVIYGDKSLGVYREKVIEESSVVGYSVAEVGIRDLLLLVSERAHHVV